MGILNLVESSRSIYTRALPIAIFSCMSVPRTLLAFARGLPWWLQSLANLISLIVLQQEPSIFLCNQIELDSDDTASDALIQDSVDVAILQVAHVLGHSSSSHRFYWDADTGMECTSRPFQSRNVTCVENVQRNLILPDDSTMKFLQGQNGRRYSAIVTPN